jgi:nucleoside-diphosphate kinase
MAIEQTLAIIKPDISGNMDLVLAILDRLRAFGLRIVTTQQRFLAPHEAREFYAEHQGEGFFENLVEFMSSGRIIVMVLQGENAIERYRALMGATDPEQAGVATIRSDYGKSKQRNAVHGSDSAAAAKREIHFFFPRPLSD